MSKYVKVDDVMAFINTSNRGNCDYFIVNQIEELCKSNKVYDVGKVVAEFESFAKLAEDRWVNGTSNHACQEHKCWVKAIEIVRKGGV